MSKKPTDREWWNFWPTLLDDELRAFDRRGIPYQVVVKKKGVLILDAQWPLKDGDPLRLRIGFSPMHPFFRPAVGTDEKFDRHQNPLTHDLCLLTQASGQWDSNQLVADFIAERVEHLLGTLAARREERWEDAATLEEQTADPLMRYFAAAGEDDSVILFNGGMALPSERHGLMDLVIAKKRYGTNPNAFEAVLRQLGSVGGRAESSVMTLPGNPAGEQLITGRWIRLQPPLSDDPAVLLQAVEAELDKHAMLQPESVRRLRELSETTLLVTGILFPDEVAYGPARNGVGALFLVTRREFNDGQFGPSRTTLVRGEYAGQKELFERLPVAQSLRGKRALIVGCGAIGGFVAVELARAGLGALTLLDMDVVEPGNSLRWPLGRQAWGTKKTIALSQFVAAEYPWTEVVPYYGRMGSAESNVACLPSDFEVRPGPLAQILAMIEGVDIVIDTSASREVQHALSYYCRMVKKPYVMGYATLGVAGGVVAVFPSDSESCWVCLVEHWKDHTIPAPLVDESGAVTPVGCSDPTFTGGSFDLQEVSLEVVRRAVGLLSNGAYDRGAWPVSILRLRNDAGRTLPHWEAHDCPPHPRCACAR